MWAEWADGMDGGWGDDEVADFGAPVPAVLRLQKAVVALGRRVGDRNLIIGVDGIIGAKTVAAANRALAVHISTALVPPQFRSGRLTLAEIKKSANVLADIVERGIGVAKIPARRVPTGPVRPVPVRLIKSQAVATLQSRLRQLGQVVKDSTLVIGVDGLVGPKTLAATNRAFQKHVVGAPPAYRAGGMTAPTIQSAAPVLAVLVGKELARRAVKPVPPLPVPPGVAADMPPTADLAPPEAIPPTPQMYVPPPPSAEYVPPPPSAEYVPPPPSEMAPPQALPYEMAPPSEMAPPAEKKFPWVPVLIGVGVLAGVGTLLIVTRKSAGSAAPRMAA